MSLFVRSIFLLSILTLVWAKHVTVTIWKDMKICTFTANLKIMILDYIFSILIKPSIGVLGLISSGKHYSFVPLNGEMVIYCIMMHTVQLRDSNVCEKCFWYVHKAGPCRYENCTSGSCVRKCYPWN